MPKPHDISPEQQTRWDEAFKHLLANPPNGFPAYLLNSPIFLPIFEAGEWLSDALTELGCDAEQRKDLCFANGQRSFMQPDVWAVAVASLERYKAGAIDKPGSALGAELMKDTFGLNVKPDDFDPGDAIYNSMRSKVN